MKKNYLIILFVLFSFVFGINNVNAVSGKMTSSYDRCTGYKITSSYRTYGVLNSLKNYSATKAGSPFNAEYVTISGSKKIVYCIQKGPELPLGKTVTYSKFSTTDDYLTSTDVKNYNKGALARAIAYGKNGTHSDCGGSSYDRVATGAMAHMLNKCIVDSSASVCTDTSKRWDYISDSSFSSRIKGLFTATSARKTGVANYAVALRNKVLQHGLVPSISYATKDDAKANLRYLTTIDVSNKDNPKFSLSLTDATKARNGVYTLASGLWKVSAVDDGITASISGAKLNVETTKGHLAKTLCVTLSKTEKTGTLYKNSTGQDTVYMASPSSKTINRYVCFTTNYIKVNKVNSQTNEPIDGAKFNIFDSEADCKANNNPVKNVSDIPFANQDSGDKYSLATGNTYFYNVKENSTKTYYVREVTPPVGYRLYSKDQCQKATLNDATGVTYKNIKEVFTNIQAYKKDKLSDDPIKGVKLGLYDDDKCSVPTKMLDTSDDEQIKETDVSGMVTWHIDYTGQTAKSLYVKEEALPTGYTSVGKNCYEVKIGDIGDGSVSNTVVIYNMPYGNIRILKKDVKTNKPISGVKFRLLDESKKVAKDKDGNAVASITTNKDGVAVFSNIVYGTYYIEEVKAAPKYKVLTEPIKIVLNKNTDSIFLTKNSKLTFKYGDIISDGVVNSQDLDALNSILATPDGTLGLDKVMFASADVNGDNVIDNNDKKIFEAYLLYNSGNNSEKILDDADSYAKRKENVCKFLAGEASCDTSTLQLDRLAMLYKSYLAVPEGVSSDLSNYTYDDVLDIWFDKDGNPVNDPSLSSCPDTSSYKFKLGDVNGDCMIDNDDLADLQELISNGTDDQLRKSAADVNGDGELTVKDSDLLNSFLGYVQNEELMKTIVKFVDTEKELGENVNDNFVEGIDKMGTTGVVPHDEAQASIVITNEKINVKISKKSIAGSKEVPGAKLVIKNSKGQLIKSFVSKKTPTEFYIAAGKYTLTETVAPAGYSKLKTVISFKVGTDGNIKLLSAKSNMYKIVNSKGEDTDLDHIIIYNKLSKEVIVPDTASNVKFIFIVLGVILIAGGGYAVYKKYN